MYHETFHPALLANLCAELMNFCKCRVKGDSMVEQGERLPPLLSFCSLDALFFKRYCLIPRALLSPFGLSIHICPLLFFL